MRMIMSRSAHTSDAPPPPEELVVRAVMRLGRSLRRAAPAVELTTGALAVLIRLNKDGATSAAALARAEGLQPQSLSRVLARMTQDGMIERAVNADDRRRHVIAITNRGRRALGWAMDERRRWIATVMEERLAPAERDTLIAAATIMLKLAD